MAAHTIDFSFTARYFTLGNVTTAQQVWFVLHGYGQLPEFFLKKFRSLEVHNIAVIAPEALSKFYLESIPNRLQSGNTRVGASWMTRENRLVDITNYITFLDAVYQQEIHGKTIPVTVLGFSQGAATASRWAMQGKLNFTRLILWAGMFPPDIDFTTGREVLKDKETVMVYGHNDPFLNDSRFAEMDLLTEKLAIQPTRLSFEGGHDIDEKTLLKLV